MHAAMYVSSDDTSNTKSRYKLINKAEDTVDN